MNNHSPLPGAAVGLPAAIVAVCLTVGIGSPPTAARAHASESSLANATVFAANGQASDEASLSLDEPPITHPFAILDSPLTRVGARTIWSTLYDGGWVGLIIIVLSLVSVAFMVEHALTIRRSTLMPPRVLHEMEVLISQGHIDRALQRCQARENACLGTEVIRAGLERFRSSESGFAEYRGAVEEAGERLVGQLYRKTDVLGVIGAIAPMLGLTGTVMGMIRSFNVIAMTGGTARPDQLAGGISEALITTLMGLFVAIPTMVAFSYFRNRIDALASEASARIERILLPLGRRG